MSIKLFIAHAVIAVARFVGVITMIAPIALAWLVRDKTWVPFVWVMLTYLVICLIVAYAWAQDTLDRRGGR